MTVKRNRFERWLQTIFHTQDKEIYRSKYEVKASEADSLRAVKSELERRLFELNQRETTDLSNPESHSEATSFNP